MESFEDLLRRDEQRKNDGFQKKIKIRKILAAPGKVIVVPFVFEEKLIHGEFEPTWDREDTIAGHGEGKVGDVVGHKHIYGEEGEDESEDEDAEDSGAGEDEGEHGIETEAYRIGKELSEKFQLPNLKDKGKKVPTDEYIYDLTDRHRGSGQFLDKKATLKSVVRTNAALGKISKDHIDLSKLVVNPRHDKIYRVLSKERVWKSQAVVFFLRDYSDSMSGVLTETVIDQHLAIYSWLLVQYEKLVIPRFIVHDTSAKEVSVEKYFRMANGGGTYIVSGYKKINEIVEYEGLEQDYNIYVFEGTDGDDFDRGGGRTIPEIEKILSYVNRMGVCVLKNYYSSDNDSVFEEYIKAANIHERKEVFRMHRMLSYEITEDQKIEAIKALIAQD